MVKTAQKFKIMTSMHTSDKYVLAVSTDSLLIMSQKVDKIVEMIVDGKDDDAYLCSTDDLDCFLDAINIIKADIASGLNPIERILRFELED